MLLREDVAGAQVEKILHSDTFRNTDVLRRLLRFLADKSRSGECAQLKEYTIGIDALGKPAAYDPRQDSVVRIQVGRLRQKLAEYYRTEGKDDPVVIDLPKGRFKLNFGSRAKQPLAELVEAAPVITPRRALPWRAIAVAFAALSILTTSFGVYAMTQLHREQQYAAPLKSAWTPELSELWKPFLATNRPLIVSVAAPLFVGFEGAGLYRDRSLNRWEDVQASAKIGAIRKALGNPAMAPRYYYAGMGDVSAAFQLGKLLTLSPMNVSVARSSQVSWQQLADNNVVFIGPPRVYAEQLRGLPIEQEAVLEERGIRNLHPRSGEPATLEDHYPGVAAGGTNVTDSGEIYALITHTPGPLGRGDFLTLSANHSPGTLAAVQWFTNPDLARALVARLRKAGGDLPRFYQVVLGVKYKDSVPTDISYVMHRELHEKIGSGAR
jgi:hypothetical protein